ncbi:MAG TPA: helix-turn-helix domain-containing protein [Pyrinomonadaceae bacterium]|nr:helix-turn-helix domain-containing protein [Pyrinomonadaceae bacterium]
MKKKELQQTPTERHEEYLTSRQLAQILQVSESTVRRLAQARRIPSIRLGTRIIRFHLPAVREALDGATHHTRPRRTSDEQEQEGAQLSFADLL